MLLHSNSQRLERSVDQVAVERTGNRTDGILEEPEPFVEGVIVGAGGAHDNIGVAVHVFGQRVVGHICAELEGTLEVGRFKGVLARKAANGFSRFSQYYLY